MFVTYLVLCVGGRARNEKTLSNELDRKLSDLYVIIKSYLEFFFIAVINVVYFFSQWI